MKRRLVMETATGQADLAWALVQLFFLMTFVAARPASGLVGPPSSEGAPADPIVISLDARGALTVTRSSSAPPPGLDLPAWLAEQCQQPRTVSLRCPDDIAHRDCRAALGELMSAGPGCSFSY